MNKMSKLKNLLLGTSVLTAALGFTGQAWAAIDVSAGTVTELNTVPVAAVTGATQYYKNMGNKLLTVGQAIQLGGFWSGVDGVVANVEFGTNAVNADMAHHLSLYLSGKRDAVVSRVAGYTGKGLLTICVSGTSPGDFNPGVNPSLVATVGGATTTIKNGGFAMDIVGALRGGGTAADTKHTLKFVNEDATGGIIDLHTMTGLEGLTVAASGTGAHKFVMPALGGAIGGITTDGTGPVVFAIDAGGGVNLTPTAFKVSPDSGVMIQNTNVGNSAALVVSAGTATDYARITMTAGAHDANNGPVGVLSGDNTNTDVTKAHFKVEGTATLTGGGTIPEISVELAPQAYNLVSDAAAAGTFTKLESGKHYVYSADGASGSANKYVMKKTNTSVNNVLGMNGLGAGSGGVGAAPAPAAANAIAKQVNGRLNLATADQTVLLSGKGEVEFNATNNQVQVVKFYNADTANASTHGEFIFTNGNNGGAAIDKKVLFAGAGAQTLTFSGATAPKVEVDNTAGDVTLVWKGTDAAHLIPGLTAAAVTDKTPFVALGSAESTVFRFSEDVVSHRITKIAAPVIIGNGAPHHIELKAGGEISSNVIINSHGGAGTIKLNGGADKDKVYNISAKAYIGAMNSVAVASNTEIGKTLPDFVAAYNAGVTVTTTSPTLLIAARATLETAISNTLETNLDAVPTFAITDGAVLNFAVEKDGLSYVAQTTAAAEGKINLGRDAKMFAKFDGSDKLELSLAQGAILTLIGDSTVKNITLGPVDGDKDSLQTIKFAKASNAPTFSKLALKDDEKIMFTGNTALRLDISAGDLDLSAGKLLVSNNYKDATGAAVNKNIGTLSIESKLSIADPKTKTPTATSRQLILADKSSFGVKDHGLAKFEVSADSPFTLASGAAANTVTVYADEVLLSSSFTDDKGTTTNKDFTLSNGAFTFNTSKMSVVANDNKLLLNAATINITPLSDKDLSVDFSVNGGKAVFGKGAKAVLGAKATSFDNGVDFEGGLVLDGAAEFKAGTTHKAVNVQESFAVKKAVEISQADFTGSDIKTSPEVLAATKFSGDDALTNARLLVFKPASDAKTPLKFAKDTSITVDKPLEADDINKLQMIANSADDIAAALGLETTFLTATSFGTGVDVTKIKVQEHPEYPNVVYTFTQAGTEVKRKIESRTWTQAEFAAASGKDDNQLTSFANDLSKAVQEKVITATTNPKLLALSKLQPKEAAEALERAMPDINASVSVTSAAVNGVAEIVNARMISTVPAGFASGDADQTKLGGWAQGFYGSAEQKPIDNKGGYDSTAKGGIVGFDFAMNDAHSIGVAGAYVLSDSTSKVNTVNKTSYTSWVFNQYSMHDITESVFLSQNLVLARTDAALTRAATMATDTDAKTFDHQSHYISGGISIGRPTNLGNAVIFTPTIGGKYQYYSDYSYTDKDNKDVGQTVKVPVHSSFVVQGSVNFAYPVQSDDYTFSPEVFAGFDYDTNPNKGAFTWNAGAFKPEVPQSDIAPVNMSYHAGAALNVKYGMFEVSPRFNTEFRKEYFGWNGSLKVRVSF